MPQMNIPSPRTADAASGRPAAATRVPASEPLSSASSAAPALPNPALRLDPELGLVVLEFRDSQGQVERTLPTARALAAYRAAARVAVAGGGAGFGDPAAPQANSASTPTGAASAADPAAITT